jgi:5,6-dimethylbenzimidazole synthase
LDRRLKLSPDHRQALRDVLTWRRDVRHFKTDPINAERLDRLRAAMDLAPSVGNARPWRVMQVQNPDKRAAIIADFEAANDEAASKYSGTKRDSYMALKLAGLREAPVHLAVFTEHEPDAGHGLGRQTMPEMLAYSTVAAIHTLWLAARADNIGMGWVSILNPASVHGILDAPATWSLTAYLCLGIAQDDNDTPLLHRKEWQENSPTRWRTV